MVSVEAGRGDGRQALQVRAGQQRISRQGLLATGNFYGESCFYISDVVLLHVSSCGGGGEEL